MIRKPNFYRDFVFPFLRNTDAEAAHDKAIRWLAKVQRTASGRALLRLIAGEVPHFPVKVCGMMFPNVIGVAAGLDKDIRVAPALGELGFGHVEGGTLTPRPQPGNPRPRVFRLVEDRAIINRMGFPNGGVRAAVPRLRRLSRMRRRFRLGISIGKQKETPLEDAARDYIAVMRSIHAFADYLAVNISSPNTPGLRELQGTDYLTELCRTLCAENDELCAKLGHRVPLFVKIAPDLETEELETMVGVFIETGMDGVIATNTTLARPRLRSAAGEEQGGLSGRPLRRPSTEIIRRIRQTAGPKFPIIGVGGIFTSADVEEKLDAGASLVQVYTGFVYEGPRMPGRIMRKIAGGR